MADRLARDQMREQLSQILAGQLDLRLFGSAPRPRTQDGSVRRLFDELQEYIVFRLPLKPGDELRDMSCSLRTRIERTIRFLDSDLEFADPDGGWSWSGIVLVGSLTIGLIILLINVVAEELMGRSVAVWLENLAFASLGLAFAVIATGYVIGLTRAAITVIRVRVLKRNLDYDDPGDLWPFSTREQLETFVKPPL